MTAPELDLQALRSAADAATPGPWLASVLGSEGYAVMADNPTGRLRRIRVARCGHEGWDVDRHNAEYIATVDPATTLMLLDEIKMLRDSVARDFGEPLDEVYKTDGITIVMHQIHDLRRKAASALAIHKPSTSTEDVWYEDCDRDGCDTSKGCNGHNTIVCDHEECWAIGEDGDALPNPWPCATARALGVSA